MSNMNIESWKAMYSIDEIYEVVQINYELNEKLELENIELKTKLKQENEKLRKCLELIKKLKQDLNQANDDWCKKHEDCNK